MANRGKAIKANKPPVSDRRFSQPLTASVKRRRGGCTKFTDRIAADHAGRPGARGLLYFWHLIFAVDFSDVKPQYVG